jgi:tripartite-type tricarboxylate transporter receptor subunit TctC
LNSRVAAWLSSVVFLAAAPVCAQNYPVKPIRMLTGEIGGGSDIAARLIAQGLAFGLGQQVVVDNRVGGIIVSDLAAKAPPDGYTLLLYGDAMWLLPLMRERVPYDPVKDFSPITLVGTNPLVLVVNPALPAKSVAELIALAKAKPAGLNYATGPSGTILHIAGELFKSMAGIDIVHVGYRGTAPAVNDLIAGRVQLIFGGTSWSMPHVRSGRLRALAVTSAQPSALLPDLPTISAAGLPGYEAVANFGVFAPVKTPPALVRLLNSEIVHVLGRPETKEKFLNIGIEAAGSTPEQLAARVRSEMTRLGKVIGDAGIRAD